MWGDHMNFQPYQLSAHHRMSWMHKTEIAVHMQIKEEKKTVAFEKKLTKKHAGWYAIK